MVELLAANKFRERAEGRGLFRM